MVINGRGCSVCGALYKDAPLVEPNAFRAASLSAAHAAAGVSEEWPAIESAVGVAAAAITVGLLASMLWQTSGLVSDARKRARARIEAQSAIL